MAKIVKVTDLTKTEGDPGPQAEVRWRRETLESYVFEIRLPAYLGGGAVKLNTRTRDGTRMANAIVTVLLFAASCLAVGAIVGASAAAGAHPSPAIIVGSFLAPEVIYLILSLTGAGRK